MKNNPIAALLSFAFCCLLPLPEANAQTDERIAITPPMPPMPPPRIELRVPDVGPMQTREMSVIAKVDGLHAVVETTLVFHNPNARDLEGDLVFPLPDGAAVCGYALDIGGVLVDGVIVTKERARVAFETETRRNVDPGLVEHVQGNLYRTRIYPLPAKGERRIRLTYTTPLATAPNGDAALLLPIPREEIAKLNVKIEVAAPEGTAPEVGGLGDARFVKAEKIWRVESSSEKTKPGEDILVALPKLPASFHRIERDAEGTHRFMITTVAPLLRREPAVRGRIHVLWDASGSRAGADLTKEFELLRKTKATSYILTVFRDAAETAREFASVDELIAAIKDAPFDGGTDIAAVSEALHMRPTSDLSTTILLFTDGFDTLSGETLEFTGRLPVAIVSQTVANRESLRQACAGALIDLQTTSPEAAWAEIESPSARVSGVKGSGIANVQGIGQPAHGRISLLGELTEAETTVRILYADGTESDPFTLSRADAAEGEILSTAWASARVNQLAPNADEFPDELLALGRSHGLVSPATSLIVLETLDQWVRHEIEPPASLPEMREQWRRSMKGRGNANDPAPRLEHIVQLWKQRVAWWESDFSKAKVQPRGKDKEGEVDAFSASEEQGNNLAPRRAAPAPSAPASPLAETARRDSGGGGFGGLSDEKGEDAGDSGAPSSSIEIKPWSPDTPYLKAIRAAKDGLRYKAYLGEREKFAQSPAFFLDCAGVFYEDGDKVLARRILTNLAELRIEDPGLLRVLAWRLQEAGELETAIVVLRRVAKLRPEEPQSFRDLSLALAGRGRATASKADLEEAMGLFLKVALGNWGRHGESIPIFALEEMNALIAWVERRDWPDGGKPQIPEFDKRLRKNLDTDIRIVMSWDSDATDMDLHVMEPGGEEAYYGHNRTARGGLVSEDITDGYGPEEYLMRKAPVGDYAISTNYYGSSQQTVVGPATVTATVFTNWGRANEKRQVLTIRLDKEKEKVDIGTITFGRGESASGATRLTVGMTRKEVIALLGKPADPDANPLEFTDGAKTLKAFFKKRNLIRVTETLPGGVETILIQ